MVAKVPLEVTLYAVDLEAAVAVMQIILVVVVVVATLVALVALTTTGLLGVVAAVVLTTAVQISLKLQAKEKGMDL